MPRPQFSLKTLLWLMALVSMFFAGAEWQRWYTKPPLVSRGGMIGSLGHAWGVDELTMPDGSTWFRVVCHGKPQGKFIFGGEHGERITVDASVDMDAEEEVSLFPAQRSETHD